MNIYKSLLLSLLLLVSFTGCQSDNSDAPSASSVDINTSVDGNTTIPPDINTTLPPIDVNATTEPRYLSASISTDQYTIVDTASGLVSVAVTEDNGADGVVGIDIAAFNTAGTGNTEGAILVGYPYVSGVPVTYLGQMSPANGVGISGGKASFTYTPPSNIAYLRSQDHTGADFLFYSSTSTDVNTTFRVVFTVPKDYSSYTLTSVPSDANITEGLQSKVIDVYLDDNSTGISKPAVGEVIMVDFFDGDSGSMNAFEGTTDANGHVVFNYTSIENVVHATTYALTFRMENDSSRIATTNLLVNTTVPTKDYSSYTLTSVPSDANITEGFQSKVIDVYLDDNSTGISKPAAGEVITLDYFDGSKGTMSSFSGTTDANGHAAFNYTSIENVVHATTYALTFRMENDSSKIATTNLLVNTTITTTDYSAYNLTLVDANRTITASSQVEVFDLYLEDNDSRPAANESILLDYFDGAVGTMNSFSGITDVNGHVAFTYTAPVNLTDLNTSTLTFKMQNNTSKDVNAVITVSPLLTQVPKIRLEKSEITVSESSENVSVKVLAFNDNGNVFNDGTISISYPSEIVDGNVSGGQFTQSEVAIVNGEAIFNFIAPNPLKSIPSLNFIFSYNSDVNATLTVNYEPSVIDVYLVEETKEITQNSQLISIEMNVVDGSNNPYSDGNVKVQFPDDIKENRDIGSFSDLNVSIVNGKATFTYTAPAQLDNNTSDIVFNFYHETNPTNKKAFTFTINPDSNQVATNYILYSSLSDNNITMGLETSKLMSFFIKDSDGALVPDANVTTFTTTILNPNLGTLSNTDGNETNTTSTTLDFTKNNITINVNSNIISGVIPIEVSATFLDVNNNEQNLSKVFNVIVVSGPPSAISLSYASTETNDGSTASFTENWILRVTDRYNNVVNSNPSVSMGMIAGYAVDSNLSGVGANNNLYFDTVDGGDIDGTANTFTAPNNVFANVNQATDSLVLFGDGFTYEASGKWSINTNTDSILDLIENYDGNDTSSLGFAVGNNHRQDPEGGEAIAIVEPKDGNYIMDDTGTMAIKVTYDYFLTGKSVMLWVNLVGYDLPTAKYVRVGEAKKITLRASGLEADVVNTSAGVVGATYRIPIKIKESPEWYRHANFAYSVKTSDNLQVNSVISSDNNLSNNVAYADVNVTDIGATPAAGTIEIVNILVADEF
ncbi:hypothetical protein [Candidatus Sulfurimonas baltica]|uniref:Big-1 domain-containing protein n=1 Tax=Candidatus Sulfurimonas baltica TaxID=2740404 RepID=A0A7S7LUW1_9BACT|nr:hypothetical protein [Candidatus Sulfurimonas baltica]QOY51924.1 hypothetical protein HUE88_12630 [Candidatus Sulfurimonas baltica]